MKCYLVRHGKDDDSVRGGWSDAPLTEEGKKQVEALANKLFGNISIKVIYSSDLERAKETSDILARKWNIPVVFLPEMREVNNGDLAGIKNEIADIRFPGLYWSSLEYTETYPNGESPAQFFQRIQNAWCVFKQNVKSDLSGDVMLVTHGGVIEAILSIETGIVFTNKEKHFKVGTAEWISVEI